MSITEAYEIVKPKIAEIQKEETENIAWELKNIYDFGSFFGFFAYPNTGEQRIGISYLCVDKESGKFFCFHPHYDFDVWDAKKEVDLSVIPKEERMFVM